MATNKEKSRIHMSKYNEQTSFLSKQFLQAVGYKCILLRFNFIIYLLKFQNLCTLLTNVNEMGCGYIYAR